MADNLDCIKLDDLDMEQRALADIIGIEAYRALIAAYGGTEIYVPKLDGFLRAERDARLRDEFDGYNFRQLAKKYGLTDVRIRSIVADEVVKARTKPIDGQVTFWGQPESQSP